MILESLQPLMLWIQANPEWTVVAAFLVAFAESLAIIGALIPGSVTLTAIGILIGTGVAPALLTLGAAVIGAISGDTISYALGYHYNQHLRELWPFSRYPAFLQKGETFFHQHGGKSIFFGRFVGPLRAILPSIAGMMKVPLRRFLIANIISGILWAPTYMLPGILIGAASMELSAEAATRFILFVLISLVALYIVSFCVKHTGRFIFKRLDTLITTLWKASPPAFKKLLSNPTTPTSDLPMWLLTLFLLCFSLFILVALSVYQHGWITAWNNNIFYFLQNIHTQTMNNIMAVITLFGEKRILAVVVFLLGLWFLYRKHYRLALHWYGISATAIASIYVLKPLIHSLRPTGLIYVKPTASFPSGHTALAVSIYGFLLVILLFSELTKQRRLLVLSLLTLIGGIAFSRLYLGAHWLSDLIGSFLLGSSLVALFALSYQRKPTQLTDGKKILGIFLFLLLSAGSYFFTQKYNFDRFAYWLDHTTETTTYQHWWHQRKPLLPLYRLNRFGRPITVFNLQWAGSLQEIRALLEKHGWSLAPENAWFEIIKRLVSTDKSQELPLFAQLYRGNKPNLVMLKKTPEGMPVLVLRLWHSHYRFSDYAQPLWIGSLNYRIVWHHHSKQPLENPTLLPTPLTLLKTTLKQYKQRWVTYPTHMPETHTINGERLGHILLVNGRL